MSLGAGSRCLKLGTGTFPLKVGSSDKNFPFLETAGSNNLGSHSNRASAIPDPIIAPGPRQSYSLWLEPQSLSSQNLRTLCFYPVYELCAECGTRVSFPCRLPSPLRLRPLPVFYITLYQIHLAGAQFGSITLLKMVFPNTALTMVCFS